MWGSSVGLCGIVERKVGMKVLLSLGERFSIEHIRTCWRMAKAKKEAEKKRDLLEYATSR